jgi:uncharacterized protein YggU (UPF0235/DUF167 family)
VSIRVSPNSSRTKVGGRRGEALVVRVTDAAVDGRATEAAMRALAHALGVPRRDVGLRSGATSRDKIVEVVDRNGGVAERVVALLGSLAG